MTESTTLQTCETGVMVAQCSLGYRVLIQDMFFGRNDLDICPHETANTNTTECEATGALDVARRYCNGRHECVIAAYSLVFGEPCSGIYKHASVQFACHSKQHFMLLICVNIQPGTCSATWRYNSNSKTVFYWISLESNCARRSPK